MIKKEIKIVFAKNGSLRAYCYSRMQLRWFPVPLGKAQEMIKNSEGQDVTSEKWVSDLEQAKKIEQADNAKRFGPGRFFK